MNSGTFRGHSRETKEIWDRILITVSYVQSLMKRSSLGILEPKIFPINRLKFADFCVAFAAAINTIPTKTAQNINAIRQCMLEPSHGFVWKAYRRSFQIKQHIVSRWRNLIRPVGSFLNWTFIIICTLISGLVTGNTVKTFSLHEILIYRSSSCDSFTATHVL